MKPPRFRYLAPATVDEAIGLLAEHGDRAKVLAGGQSLVPLLNMRLSRPEVLIDLNRIDELAYIRIEQDVLRIGAMTRQRTVERSAQVVERCPVLVEAVRHIGHTQIRNRGTIGGSIVHADPSAELPAILSLLEGRVKVRGPAGEREIPHDELFLTYFTTTLMPDEIATEIILPLPGPATGWSFIELARRHGDFALVAVGCLVDLAEDGTCREARLALTGVGGTPVRVPAAEAALRGHRCEDDVLAAVTEAVAEGIDPESDIHASADFRRHLAGVLSKRAVQAAWQRAVSGSGAA